MGKNKIEPKSHKETHKKQDWKNDVKVLINEAKMCNS